MKNTRKKKSLIENRNPVPNEASDTERGSEAASDAREAGELYSAVGERVYEVAGTERPIENDKKRNRGASKGRLRAKQKNRNRGALDKDQPLVPDGAFSGTRRIKTPEAVTQNQDEVAPYREHDGSVLFGEGDKIRHWTTGLGEQEAGEPTGRTTTGGETTTMSD
ncbi:MAG TPA: hypothetical protein VFD70_23290 [Anaerolineae bacterium]|nr:hypothetical protein [Anaerolineae bacterium]